MKYVNAIILAAGISKRLRPITNNKPKCLLDLDKGTVLDYQLECLARSNINQILVVAGYKKNMIIDYINQLNYNDLIKVIYNDIFDKTDNAYSITLALEHIDTKIDSVIILDGDIIFDIELLDRLIKSEHENVVIADNIKKIEPEDCKILIEGGHVVGIGKKIQGNTVYTSMIKLNGKFLDEFKKELKKPRIKLEWYSEPLNRLLIKYPAELHAIFTNGLLRCEIDTYEDLIHAKKVYKRLRGEHI